MRWIILALALAVAGCAGSGGGVTAGGGGGPLPTASLKALDDAMFKAFQQNGGKARSVQIAAYLKVLQASPICKNSGYSTATDNVYCTLQDGMPYAFFDNTPADGALPRGYTGGIRSLARDEVPFSKEARIFHMFGNAFSNDTPHFSQWLTSAGYTVQTSTGSFEDLTTKAKDLGFLYLGGHGGVLPSPTGEPVFSVSTTVEDTPANRAKPLIAALLADPARPLARVSATFDNIPNPVDVNGNGQIDSEERLTVKTVFSITPAFVRKYMGLSESSLVIVRACSSLNTAMTTAFGDVGAEAYIGWDVPAADTGDVIRRAMDLMLGQNFQGPDFDPDYRPFQIDKVFAYMKSKGLNVASHANHQGTKAKLDFRPLAGTTGYGLLRPAIKKITVAEATVAGQKDKIIIEGVFGRWTPSVKREVFVDDVPLAIIDDGGEKNNRIVCEIRRRGQGSFGPCVVKIQGRPSRPVPITQWTVPMRFDFDGPGGCFYRVDLSLKLRADVHLYRDELNNTFGGVVLPNAWNRGDTSGSFVAGGTDGNQTWSGSGTFASLSETTDPTKYCLFTGNLDTAKGEWGDSLIFAGGGAVKVVFTNGAQTGFPPALSTLNTFSLKFDPQSFAILGGSQLGPITASGRGTLTWPTTPGNFAPTPTTTR